MNISQVEQHRVCLVIEVYNEEDNKRAYEICGNVNSSAKDIMLVPAFGADIIKKVFQLLNFMHQSYEKISLSDAEKILQTQSLKIKYKNKCTYLDIYNQLYNNQYFDLANHVDWNQMEVSTKNKPIIIAITEESIEQAMKFGILTGRYVLYVKDFQMEHIFKVTRHVKSYVVCCPESLSVDSLSEIYNAKNKSKNLNPIGFMYPFGKFNREFVVLKTYLYNMIHNENINEYNFFYPLEKVSKYVKENKSKFFLGNVDEEEMEKSLKGNSNFLFATPHSNGIDMSFGSNILCAREGFEETQRNDIKKAMPCFYGGMCSRKNGNNHLLRVSEIRSILVFLYTCWGVILENGIYDVRTSLAYQFAASPYNVALITTYSMSLLDRESGINLAKEYNRGKEIGEAIESFNQMHYELYKDTENVIMLFGDPEYRNMYQENIDFDHMISQNKYLRKFFQKPEIQDTELKKYTDNNEISKMFFDNMNYIRCIINGSRNLNIEAINIVLGPLEKITNDLWMFAILNNNRLEQSNNFGYNEVKIKEKIRAYYETYQKCFYTYYTTLVHTLGGFVRFQVDRYFSLSKKLTEDHPKCCHYCNTPIAIEEKTMNTFGIKRKLFECLNCATVYDAMEAFCDGYIVCEKYWKKNISQEINVEIETVLEGEVNYLVGVILEPFNKKIENSEISIYTKGSLIMKERSQTFSLGKLVPTGLCSGCYHLNAIVILNESVVFLRRAIYVVDETEVI